MAIPGYFKELYKTTAKDITYKIDTKEMDYPLSNQTFVDGYKSGLLTALAILNKNYIQILDMLEKNRDKLNKQHELNNSWIEAERELNNGRK